MIIDMCDKDGMHFTNRFIGQLNIASEVERMVSLFIKCRNRMLLRNGISVLIHVAPGNAAFRKFQHLAAGAFGHIGSYEAKAAPLARFENFNSIL